MWQGDADSRNSERVAWERVTLTKKQGGLDVRDLQTWITACCLRLIWLLFFRSDSVWIEWFKEVILQGSVHNYWSTNPKPSYSWLVNKLLKLKSIVYPLIHLCIQNGRQDKFWYDNWSPFWLSSYFPRRSNYPKRHPKQRYNHISFSQWILATSPARSDQYLQLLTYMTTFELTMEEDYYEWKINGKTSDHFKTGEVYHYLRGALSEVRWASIIWPSWGIPRHSFLSWLVIQDCLPTKDRLLRWGLQVPPTYLLCNSGIESRNYLYGDCPLSFDLWRQIATRCCLNPVRDWEGSVTQLISLPHPRSSKLLTLIVWQSTQY